MIFTGIWLILIKRSNMSIKTNTIFWISIKNWVSLYKILIVRSTFFFVEKFAPGPPQGQVKKTISSKQLFYCLSICYFEFYCYFTTLSFVSDWWNKFSRRFNFWLDPEGDQGRIFRRKKKSIEQFKFYTSLLSFLCWFRISY